MLESFKSERVKFPKNKQAKFLIQSREILAITWNEFAEMLDISVRQLSDWKKEKFSMPLSAIKKICAKTNKKIPNEIEIKTAYWYTKKAGQKGGLAVLKKYGTIGGDQEKRQKQWHKWWEEKGRFDKSNIANMRLPIQKPEKTKELAEFAGIVLGDGGISTRQITISLHHEDDKEYINFVTLMIEKLFGVKPSVYHKQKHSIKNIVISRTELIDFCTNELGLKIGNKVHQQVDIPSWIKRKRDFEKACVRGLIDTDGSVFAHKYKVNGKGYSYKKLQFTSLSKPLLLSVFNILKKNGLNPRMARAKEVWLDSKMSMNKYFEIIGSNNPKHLKRYQK